MYFKTATTGTDYKVGINNNQPQATLDINGGVKVSSNCESKKCDADHAGMIVYYEDNDK